MKASVTAGDALVLATSPERPTLSVVGRRGSAQRGEHPRFRPVPSGPGRRLVRCHVFGPDGAFLPVYARNVLVEGGSRHVRAAHGSRRSRGTMAGTVTDLLSGASASAELELR